MGYRAIMKLVSISFKVSRNDGDEIARRKDARNPDALQGPGEEEEDKDVSDFGRWMIGGDDECVSTAPARQ